MSDQDRSDIQEMLDQAQEDLSQEQAARTPRPRGIRQALSRSKHWYKTHKKRSVPLTILVVLAVWFAVPFTRYTFIGLFVRRDVEISVVDSLTKKAVSGADVSLRGEKGKTDGDGKVTLRSVRPGSSKLTIKKPFYADYSSKAMVGITARGQHFTVELHATGRQIPIRVSNKITGDGIAGAKIEAAGLEAQTDKNGNATIVADTSLTDIEAELKADGFNTSRVKITPAQEVSANSFALTPSGKLYFLSKKSGKIDVAKTDLDGTSREVALAGTGNEEDSGTVLLASKDWKFLALLARRDGNRANIYLIDTTNDKLTQIDTNDAAFTLSGWSGHNFVYQARSNSLKDWQPKQTVIKSFNADSGQLAVVDETNATGSSYADYTAESFTSVYLLGDQIVYAKNWLGDSVAVAGKRPGVYSASSNGSSKKLVKDFDQSYLTIVQSEPKEIYVQQSNAGNAVFYSYANGVLNNAPELTSAKFSQFYPTYLESPNSKRTFWFEPRDGKNVLFIGGAGGENGTQLLSEGEYSTYGWFSEDYVLISKNGSELYIAPATAELLTEQDLQKVTDYHKPTLSYPGYGGGYGGI